MLAAVAVPLVFIPGLTESAARSSVPGDAADGHGQRHAGWPFAVWAGLYAVAGFQALSLEIVWFRLLGVMVKSSAFTFGRCSRSTSPDSASARPGSGCWESCAGRAARSCCCRPSSGSMRARASWRWSRAAALAPLAPFGPTSASYEPLDAASAFAPSGRPGHGSRGARQFIRLYLLLPPLLVGPPTIAMGASFPLLQNVALVDLSASASASPPC